MSACSPEWNERVSAWLDGEVERMERVRVEAHLAGCPGCAAAAAAFGRLGAALRRGAGLARAQHGLPARRRVRPALRAAALAAGLALVAGGVAGGAWLAGRGGVGLDRGLASDAERTHLRSFSRASPCEFESRDAGAVASWLEGALGFSVPVPDLPGATLLGARRCALGGQPAAHLLYRVGERALTVLVPGAGSPASAAVERVSRGGASCTAGPLGERICAVPLGRPALAVSELDPPALLALFDAPRG
ncbi:zf-HC2 domain-containing protein [Anaeromyxobacter dehalogenans]|uniref:Putative transmembrane transcriptional regulator (Anti-sigma factor) n=1 Tax=Anaeromyxobacter dehalogenans (strain 2CP-C) TaxID=290397 RepID=Q2IJT4_ANADE|nr:zf-HC2 domain-containing protein [Anaeromyxobacter dehalogenans]ABC81914.1 putative transmembrane transcriptional regulator (anti-sigma factor) [Anaeromyxobacter dehalogenans 2CP-C]